MIMELQYIHNALIPSSDKCDGNFLIRTTFNQNS